MIDGVDVNMEKASIEKLQECLAKKEESRSKLMEQQNEYISNILC